MEEVWKDIEGYEGMYQVSNFGSVRSLDRLYESKIRNNNYIVRRGINLKSTPDKDGYLKINLSKNRTRKYHFVHRLVALVFIPNPNSFPIINHKDGNKTNNFANNLEWCTYKYNSNYGECRQKISNSKKKKVVQIDIKKNIVVSTFDSIAEATNSLSLKGNKIGLCCAGKRKTHGGFKWMYLEHIQNAMDNYKEWI